VKGASEIAISWVGFADQVRTSMTETAEISFVSQALPLLSPEAREQMIVDYLPLVKHIARRTITKLPPSVDLNDLIGAGVIGLLDAVDKFDPGRNVKFKTYAEIRIRGAMLDSLRALDLASRGLREKANKIEEVCWQLEQENGRAASDEEIAGAMGVSMGEFNNVLADLRSVTVGSFTTAAKGDSEDDDLDLINYIPDPNSDILGTFERKEIQRALADAIRRLPEREQQVLSLYYHEELTMKQIGEVLGVGEARICQIHSKAVLKLRAKLRNLR